MKQILLFICCLIACTTAQAQYTMQGKIEYERKTNLHRRMDDMIEEDDNTWLEKARTHAPKFINAYFNLSFNTANTLYEPGREADVKNNMWFAQIPSGENIVHTNFATGKVTATKNVFEEKFLVEDSMRTIAWRIKDEVRTIAGYKCRKAVGVICDSVYVVAFYTEDIMVNGGPEMFSGLPGMILEIAIPRMYTTWIATKVDTELLKDKTFAVPAKGKKTNTASLQTHIGSSIKDWGKGSAQRTVWWVTI
jgi:Protein of unknown function (Porph_ging).